MKRLIVLAVILLSSSYVYAGACGDYDYAELKDMDQPTLTKEYCKVLSKGRIYAGVAMGRGTRQSKSDFDSCYELLEKMERIYMKNFKIENAETIKDFCKE